MYKSVHIKKKTFCPLCKRRYFRRYRARTWQSDLWLSWKAIFLQAQKKIKNKSDAPHAWEPNSGRRTSVGSKSTASIYIIHQENKNFNCFWKKFRGLQRVKGTKKDWWGGRAYPPSHWFLKAAVVRGFLPFTSIYLHYTPRNRFVNTLRGGVLTPHNPPN